MASIPVHVGKLTEPLVRYTPKAGTTLVEFLAAHDMKYSAAVKVMGKAVKQSYVLQAGDIVTIIDDVTGGC